MKNDLPALMGLPEETYITDSSWVAHYTCVVNNRRVYVFQTTDDEWFVEAAFTRDATFAGWLDKEFVSIPANDPLLLLATIQHLTSKGNDDAGTDQGTEGRELREPEASSY